METRQYKMTVGVVFLVSMIGAAAIHGSFEPPNWRGSEDIEHNALNTT